MDGNSVSPLHGVPGRGILCFSWMTSSALSGTLESSPFGLSSTLFLFLFFFLSYSSKSMSAWQTEETSRGVKVCDSPDSGSQTVRKEQWAILHLRPSSLCLLPHYLLTRGKPALHPPFLAGPAVTRTRRQGHKLAHKASFCLDHGPTWYGKEKPSVTLQDKGRRERRWNKAKRKSKKKFPGWLKGKCDQYDGDKWESHQPLPSSYSNSPKWYAYWPFLGSTTWRSIYSEFITMLTTHQLVPFCGWHGWLLAWRGWESSLKHSPCCIHFNPRQESWCTVNSESNYYGH